MTARTIKTNNDLIANQRRKFSTHFMDTFSSICIDMIHTGYKENILHNPRLVMYKLLGRTFNGHTVNKSDVKKFEGLINMLKYQGHIQNHWTIDTAREITTYSDWENITSTLGYMSENFYFDRWKGQDKRVILMCEASGYLGVMKNIADEFRVPYVPAKGDMSITLKIDISNSIKRPTTIIYFGDYDSKGISIPQIIERDMNIINPDMDVTFHRMFISECDISKYDLELDDNGTIQMEQFPTGVAIRETKELIHSMLDQKLWDERLKEEESIRNEFRKLVNIYGDVS